MASSHKWHPWQNKSRCRYKRIKENAKDPGRTATTQPCCPVSGPTTDGDCKTMPHSAVSPEQSRHPRGGRGRLSHSELRQKGPGRSRTGTGLLSQHSEADERQAWQPMARLPLSSSCSSHSGITTTTTTPPLVVLFTNASTSCDGGSQNPALRKQTAELRGGKMVNKQRHVTQQ